VLIAKAASRLGVHRENRNVSPSMMRAAPAGNGRTPSAGRGGGGGGGGGGTRGSHPFRPGDRGRWKAAMRLCQAQRAAESSFKRSLNLGTEERRSQMRGTEFDHRVEISREAQLAHTLFSLAASAKSSSSLLDSGNGGSGGGGDGEAPRALGMTAPPPTKQAASLGTLTSTTAPAKKKGVEPSPSPPHLDGGPGAFAWLPSIVGKPASPGESAAAPPPKKAESVTFHDSVFSRAGLKQGGHPRGSTLEGTQLDDTAMKGGEIDADVASVLAAAAGLDHPHSGAEVQDDGDPKRTGSGGGGDGGSGGGKQSSGSFLRRRFAARRAAREAASEGKLIVDSADDEEGENGRPRRSNTRGASRGGGRFTRGLDQLNARIESLSASQDAMRKEVGELVRLFSGSLERGADANGSVRNTAQQQQQQQQSPRPAGIPAGQLDERHLSA
jgi:hypothetical protein